MTTTPTVDVNATLQQVAELTAAGCDIVRVACPSQDDADALPAIACKSKSPHWPAPPQQKVPVAVASANDGSIVRAGLAAAELTEVITTVVSTGTGQARSTMRHETGVERVVDHLQ